MNKLDGKVVLITGGTRGIGLATGLAFAKQGAKVVLTYKWGSVNEEEVCALFAAQGLPPPEVVRADVASDEDTAALLDKLAAEVDSVDTFVSNVSTALVTRSLADYKKRSLFKGLEYSAWPFVAYPQAIKGKFGRYPRYIVGISSGGPDHFHADYDFVAASKGLMEVLSRYMSYRLYDEGVRVNVVRATQVRTESLRVTFGDDIEGFLERAHVSEDFMEPEEVANAILALCSGLMDGVSGQVLTVDRGGTFRDTLMRLYDERELLDF